MILPSVIALPCNLAECENLTTAEQNELVLALLQPETTLPTFTLSLLDEDQIQKADSRIIKDAWVKISGISPSILQNVQLIVPDEVNITIAHNYSMIFPTGSDCYNTQRLIDLSSSLSLWNNDRFIGSGEEYIVGTSQQNNFLAKLSIQTTYEIDHYSMKRRCTRPIARGCLRWEYVCEFDSTETITDSLTLEDSVYATQYVKTPDYRLEIINASPVRGRLTIENVSAFELQMDNSSYRWYNASYSLVLDNNRVVVKENPTESVEQKNIIGHWENQSFSLIVPTFENCTISIMNVFSTQRVDCVYSIENPETIDEPVILALPSVKTAISLVVIFGILLCTVKIARKYFPLEV